MNRRAVPFAGRFLAMAVLAVLAACASAAPRTDAYAGRSAVRVENQSWSDMVIYVQRGSGSRQRLGTVVAQGTQTFTLPQSMVGGGVGLRLVADPVGSGTSITSNSLDVFPGRIVTWRINN